MAITLVGVDASSGTGAQSSLSGLSFPIANAGDFAVLIWTMQTGLTSNLDPAFTLVDQTDATVRSILAVRQCDGTEFGADINLSASSNNRMSAVVAVYRGVSGIDASTTFDETATTTSHASPSVTPTVAGCKVVVGISERVNSGTTSATAPAGYTREAQFGTGGNGGCYTGLADDLSSTFASGVPTTPGAWTTTTATPNVLTRSITLAPTVSGTTHQITASGAGTSTGSAAITIAPRTYAATAAGTGATTGAVAITRQTTMGASGTGTSTGSATLARQTSLAASGTGQSSGSAALTVVNNAVTHDLTAAGTGNTTGAAAVQVDPRIYPLAAIGTASTDGAAAITRQTTVTASGTGATDGATALSVTHATTATGADATGGTAALTANRAITATGSSTSGGDALIGIVGAAQDLPLTADGSGTTSGGANLTMRVVIAAAGASTSSGTALLGIVGGPQIYPLTAAGTGQTSGTAEVTIPAKTVQLTAAGLSQLAGSAALDILRGGLTPVYDLAVVTKPGAVGVVQKSPTVDGVPTVTPGIGVTLRPYSISVEER